MQGLRSRDDAAFAAMYRRHYGAVLGYALRRLADRETAREVALDVFRVAWERFDPAAEPDRRWLLGVARNRIGDAYRARAREQRLDDLLRSEPTGASGLGHPDAGDRVREALAALPAETRELLMLTYWDGLPAAEVGAVLGCSAGAVWVRLHRARKAFTAVWEEQAR